ncbi:hypothetical protein [Hydrogenobacter thermophilus]|uniref:hypothetical protein n=1 Tax=Hydrogenobacter thermophilus TaxID=940 RepID=UPI0030F726A9
MKAVRIHKTARQLLGDISTWEGVVVLITASLFFAWFPDTLKDIIYSFLPFQDWLKALILFIVSIIALVPLALLIRKFAEKLKDVSYYVEEDKELLIAKRVRFLIIGLSEPNCKLEEEIKKIKEIPEDKRIELYIENSNEKFNWIMPVCLIKRLQGAGARLEKVYILPSKDSEKHIGDFLEYAGLFGLSKELFESLKGVEYEDLEALQREINNLIKKLKEEKGIGYRQLLIDITPGTKTFSVVASALTFDKEIAISYLNNERKLKIFDITPASDNF